MVEDRAELAGLALERGETDVARQALVLVLAYLEENPALDGSEHPCRVYLICGRVLLATGEATRACGIINEAYQRLMTLAEKLPTPVQREQFWGAQDYAALRRAYMENVAGSQENTGPQVHTSSE